MGERTRLRIGTNEGVRTVRVYSANPKTADGFNTFIFRRDIARSLNKLAWSPVIDGSCNPTPEGIEIGDKSVRYSADDKQRLTEFVEGIAKAQKGPVENEDFGHFEITKVFAAEVQCHAISTRREIEAVSSAADIARSMVHFAGSPNEELKRKKTNKYFEYGLAKVQLSDGVYLVMGEVGIRANKRPYYDQRVVAKFKVNSEVTSLHGQSRIGESTFECVYDNRFRLILQGVAEFDEKMEKKSCGLLRMNFDLPLVSFCLKAYNQKEFIGEALEGALGQTYRPLEIVICDDHSTDGTWEMICERLGVREKELGDRSQELGDRGQELVVGGPESGVRIVLHRNETNLGNCKNWEMCGKLAQGELLIKADGDDVSLPERTTKVVEAWVKDGKRAKVVSHGCEMIDTKGQALGVRNDIDARHPLGACMTWSKDCFGGWPEVQTKFAYDDIVYSFRARLLGGELVLPENLVRYRVGSGDTSVLEEYRGPLMRRCRGFLDAIPQCRRDLEWARKLGNRTVDEVARELDEYEKINGAWIEILEGRFLWRRVVGARRVWHHHGFRGHVLIVLLILPFRVGDSVINLLLRRKNGGVRA